LYSVLLAPFSPSEWSTTSRLVPFLLFYFTLSQLFNLA
jgi:hypothetical protein